MTTDCCDQSSTGSERQLGLSASKSCAAGLRCFWTTRQSNVYCLVPLNSIVAQPSSVHFLAKLLGVPFNTLTGKSVPIACAPVKFDLLANTFIERQKTLIFRL
jgi:hypothetical protein